MEKAGWQVSTFVAGMVAVAATFGMVANKSALTQERNDRQECPETRTEVQVVERVRPIEQTYGVMEWPDGVQCRGGVLIIRTTNSIESLRKNGRSMTCTENPWNR